MKKLAFLAAGLYLLLCVGTAVAADPPQLGADPGGDIELQPIADYQGNECATCHGELAPKVTLNRSSMPGGPYPPAAFLDDPDTTPSPDWNRRGYGPGTYWWSRTVSTNPKIVQALVLLNGPPKTYSIFTTLPGSTMFDPNPVETGTWAPKGP